MSRIHEIPALSPLSARLCSHGFDTEFRGEVEQEYTCNEKGEYVHDCGEPSE
jgi:hypothetical protein